MPLVLRLYEDVLSSDSAEVSLPPLPRMVFVAHGSVTIADRTLRDGEAWNGEGAVTLKAGREGATLWRWEMAAADAAAGTLAARGVVCREKLIASTRNIAEGPAASARRQCRVPGRRMCLSAPPSGSRHPLFV